MTAQVKLSVSEIEAAASVGKLRRLQSIAKGYNKNVHALKSDWATDIDGAAAEMAVCRVLNRYWSCSSNNLHGDDIEGGIQVRSTCHPNGHLVLRKRDEAHKDSLFFLVITDLPTCTVVGAIKGADAMTEKYYRPADERGGACWWVPQQDLIAVGKAR